MHLSHDEQHGFVGPPGGDLRNLQRRASNHWRVNQRAPPLPPLLPPPFLFPPCLPPPLLPPPERISIVIPIEVGLPTCTRGWATTRALHPRRRAGVTGDATVAPANIGEHHMPITEPWLTKKPSALHNRSEAERIYRKHHRAEERIIYQHNQGSTKAKHSSSSRCAARGTSSLLSCTGP